LVEEFKKFKSRLSEMEKRTDRTLENKN